MKKIIFTFLSVPLFLQAQTWEPSEVVKSVEEVNSLREALVSGVSSQKVNVTTFKAACGPVGKMAKEKAKTHSWGFRQTSKKYRNPKNAPTAFEKKILKRFKKRPGLTGVWLKKAGKDHYFRRITVQKKCLNCHGAKDKRPEFIKNKYKKDRAFGFREGDLRGVYHIFKVK